MGLLFALVTALYFYTFVVAYEFTHSFINIPMTSFDCNIHSYIFPDVIKYDVMKTTRVILHQGGVR